ncbi:MAG: 30S ribosomal protein S20 [Acidobacteria bacterium]|nr:30S ribosomal protein S20 [Acidobacteriota bacterium]
MPNMKSAEKRMRQNEIRRSRNRQRRSEMRTEIKKFRQLLSEQKKDEARKLLQGVYAVIDRTAQKGVIHSKTAARYKSRLTKRLNESAS